MEERVSFLVVFEEGPVRSEIGGAGDHKLYNSHAARLCLQEHDRGGKRHAARVHVSHAQGRQKLATDAEQGDASIVMQYIDAL